MPRYSVTVTTIRDVVVEAANPYDATMQAKEYAKDCLPSTVTRKVCKVVKVSDRYRSITSDDAHEIPRDT